MTKLSKTIFVYISKGYLLNPDIILRNFSQLILFELLPQTLAPSQRLILQFFFLFTTLATVNNYTVNTLIEKSGAMLRAKIKKVIYVNALVSSLGVIALLVAVRLDMFVEVNVYTMLVVLIVFTNVAIGPITLFLRNNGYEWLVLLCSSVILLGAFFVGSLEALAGIAIVRLILFIKFFWIETRRVL